MRLRLSKWVRTRCTHTDTQTHTHTHTHTHARQSLLEHVLDLFLALLLDHVLHHVAMVTPQGGDVVGFDILLQYANSARDQGEPVGTSGRRYHGIHQLFFLVTANAYRLSHVVLLGITTRIFVPEAIRRLRLHPLCSWMESRLLLCLFH